MSLLNIRTFCKNTIIGNVFSQWPLLSVRWSVGRSVGWLIIILQKGWKLQFYAPIEVLVSLRSSFILCFKQMWFFGSQVPGQPPRVTYTPGLKASMAAQAAQQSAAASAAQPSPVSGQPTTPQQPAAGQATPQASILSTRKPVVPMSTHLTINSQVSIFFYSYRCVLNSV